MEKRLNSLRRIWAVQDDLRRIAELKLADLQRQQQAAQANEERLVSYLDESYSFTVAYTKTITDKLRAVGKVKLRLEQERGIQARKLLDCARRKGQIERTLDDVSEQSRRSDERRDLDAAIEAESTRKRASFP